MKDHRRKRRLLLPWIFLLFCLFAFTFFRSFTFFRFFFKEGLRPKLVTSSLPIVQLEAVSGELSSPTSPTVSIEETVILPDQVLLFLKYPPATPLFTRDAVSCVYSRSSSHSHGDNHYRQPKLFQLQPTAVDDDYYGRQMVRCPRSPRGSVTSLSAYPNGNLPAAGPTYRWDSLAYEATIDRDNSTIVFVKGFNLKSGRVSDPSKFKCVYGWDFSSSGPTKFLLQSDVVSAAQEIVRCRTPGSILSMLTRDNRSNPPPTGPGDGDAAARENESVGVSVRIVGKRDPLKSVARLRRGLDPGPTTKQHEMCICTMLRNQAQFLREWIIYHSRIGVGRWYIYDNNSDDEIESVIQSLSEANYDISRHLWPWIKTQEAGFSHCALRARSSCKWVGFIDVDEFFRLPSKYSSLHDVLSKYEKQRGGDGERIGELRVSCLDFGPSGQRRRPSEGVTVGYTCRMRFAERHKSIVRPEALNETLINSVHHFHLKYGYRPAHLRSNTKMLAINHYKYQVWEVFKEKFYRRVGTYVSDWQRNQNARSKDRTPGLGTKAVEPPDWSSRFCQVNDSSLHDWVLATFANPVTGELPWNNDIS